MIWFVPTVHNATLLILISDFIPKKYVKKYVDHHKLITSTFEFFIERISEWTKMTLDFSSTFEQNKFIVKCGELEKYDFFAKLI